LLISPARNKLAMQTKKDRQIQVTLASCGVLSIFDPALVLDHPNSVSGHNYRRNF
jgi:hypothetical protein